MASRPVEIKALQIAGGISKQPAHERFAGQVGDASNAVFNLADGASKRPGSIYVKKVTGLTTGNGSIYRLHAINRDATEKYLVVYAINTLKVFHIDGTEATVNGADANATLYYAANSATASQLRFLSVADYTLIANTTVALGVSATPSYTLTAEWATYDRMTSHTPTSLPNDTAVNSAGDASYHRTEEDSAEEPAGYYQYNVNGNTFPTMQFAPVGSGSGGIPADWSSTTLRGFKVRFEKRQDTFTGATWTAATRTLTKTNNWTSFNHQPGDQIYLSGGTGHTIGWYTIERRASASSLVLSAAAGLGGANNANTAGGGIGQEYRVTFNGTGGELPTMHDVALFIQRKLQAAGANDALIGWTDTVANTGYFTITGPWRGSGAKITSVTTNPSAPGGGANDETAAGKAFDPAGTVYRVDGSGSGPRTLPVSERWVRAAAPGDSDGQIDNTKAPIKMVRTTYNPAGSTFTYDLIDWTPRTSGTDASNPSPKPFTDGYTVADLGYHRQRFMIAAGEYILFSAANDLFRFYLDDANNLVDTDPIAAPTSSNRVTIIDRLTPVRDSVLVTTYAGQQFALTAPEVLSPSTVAFVRATTLQTLRTAPVTIDPTVYMAAAAGGKSQLREAYFVDGTVPNDAADVSAHVAGTDGPSGLLPADIQTLTEHANSRTVFALPNPGSNVIYLYRSAWNGARKEQSAWSKWTFDASYRISDICVIDDFLYMLIESANQWIIEKVPVFEPAVGNYPHTLHTDRQMQITGSYAAGVTTWTLPNSLSDTTINSIVKQTGVNVTVLAAAGTTVTATGDHSGASATLGRTYPFSLTLSEPYVRDQDGRAVISRVMSQRQFLVQYVNSGAFNVVNTPDAGSNTVTFAFTPASGYTANGQFLALAGGDMSRLTITISSSSVTPVTIAGFTHVGEWGPRMH